LCWSIEGKLNPFVEAVSSAFEEEAWVAFEDYVVRGLLPGIYGSIAYLILIDAQEGQVSYLVVMVLGDRIRTGPLFALDVNARTIYNKTVLLVAEGAQEDMQRN
jgi:hypothetical protein